MRIKDILYIFISKETKDSIIKKSKSLWVSNQINKYELSYEKDPFKYNEWSSKKLEANRAIEQLENYMSKDIVKKILQEFKKMAQIIIEYGKVSFASDVNVSDLTATSIYCDLISGITSEIYKIEIEIYKSSSFKKFYGVNFNLSFDHSLKKFLNQLNSLLFISTFSEKNTRPALKKIKNL